MTTQVFLEGYQLDVSADISSLLTFALDDVKDFASRQTTFSKTIVLPGTSTNNNLFGHVFDFGSANEYNPLAPNIAYNFNAAKAANCVIFQDNLQTFSGTLRLMAINWDKGRPEYDVAVFGNLSRLNVLLAPSATNGTGLLEDLDFSGYDHVFNETSIANSWNNPGGSSYYYPLMDYGTYSVNKHDWKVNTFRPALYAKEYIDKMFSVAGFRYSCELFDSARFKSLIIPHNQKILQRLATNIFNATRSVSTTVLTHLGTATARLPFQTVTTSVFTASGGNSLFTYTGAAQTATVTFTISGYRKNSSTPFQLNVRKNGVPILGQGLLISTFSPVIAIPFIWQQTDPFVISLVPGDTLDFYFDATASGGDLVYELSVVDALVNLDTQSAVPVPVVYGDTVQMNYAIPKNIKQIDFFVSIIKLFNLYVWEDKFDTTLINIAPFNTDGINTGFFSPLSGNSVDWTYKLNRDKNISIKPMSELNSKIYNFNYKEDGDYYNNQYKKRYNQGYGSYIFDSQFEFNTAQDNLELIFAATPLVGYNLEDKIYSTIFKLSGTTEETIDSVIRILQTKKVDPVTSWDLLASDGVTVYASYTKYGYAGHLDDPDAPANDLNFGALQELYFVLVSGNLSANQFNVYWSAYMAEITDKDSKLITGNFYLRPSDIFNLDFRKYIVLDGVLFRLNKIIDYNASIPGDCKVELLRVINTDYVNGTT